MEENLMLNLVQDGTTSVALNGELIASAAGLTLTDNVEGTVAPISDEFTVGFDITEESDFIFSENHGFTPLRGEIEHTGTITFSSDLGDITVGDFAIGFDADRQNENASGFFVENTFEGVLPDGAILFDVGNPESLEITDTDLSLGSANLLVAEEFASVLVETGLATVDLSDLTGADVGDATINATVIGLTDLNPVGIEDGTTSVTLDGQLIASAAGLSLPGDIENTAEPITVDFDISEASDFLFTANDGFAPIVGEIEHTGTVTFSSDLGDITVGDFAIGFDADRQNENASGFFVENTVEGVLPDGAILFDVGNPESLEITDTDLSLGSANLLVAEEFASVLVETGLATVDLTGADVGDVSIAGILSSDSF
ncbi:MAG: hypothetical protein AB4372_02720 [Xenococcus sp. (in: cyanobacteria)]